MQLKQIVLSLFANLFSEILRNKKVIPIFLMHHHWRHHYMVDCRVGRPGGAFKTWAEQNGRLKCATGSGAIS
jgi:hypothetical protein